MALSGRKGRGVRGDRRWDKGRDIGRNRDKGRDTGRKTDGN